MLELSDLLTTNNPLGPLKHETILRRSADKPTDILIFHVDLFTRVMSQSRPMIVGRRGAGKTAIVTAFLAAAGREHGRTGRVHAAHDSEDIYAFVNSWDHLAELVDKVGLDTRHSMGDDGDWTSVLPETVANHWKRRLWHVIFQQIYADAMSDKSVRSSLTQVVRYITGDDFIPESSRVSNESITASFNGLIKSVLDYLEENDISCFLVIDSLETYPVLSPKFQKLLSGFIRCVNEFSDQSPRVKIICCVPDEISPVIAKKSPNKIKDLSESGSVSQLRWKPIDLLRIVAERYRAFLNIHHDDVEFCRHISGLNFIDRRHLREFYSSILPDFVTNRHAQPEHTLAYIIRHTQLLPREFLLIFDRAICLSHGSTGRWGRIDASAIVDAVRETEPIIADQILSPYETLYPNLVAACNEHLVNMQPIFQDSELRAVTNRLIKSVRHETEVPWQVLFSMGVIGYCDDLDNINKSSVYQYGRFHYNSAAGITLGNNRTYCIHPVFSGTWGLRPDGAAQTHKYIYPTDVEFEL